MDGLISRPVKSYTSRRCFVLAPVVGYLYMYWCPYTIASALVFVSYARTTVIVLTSVHVCLCDGICDGICI